MQTGREIAECSIRVAEVKKKFAKLLKEHKVDCMMMEATLLPPPPPDVLGYAMWTLQQTFLPSVLNAPSGVVFVHDIEKEDV